MAVLIALIGAQALAAPAPPTIPTPFTPVEHGVVMGPPAPPRPKPKLPASLTPAELLEKVLVRQ